MGLDLGRIAKGIATLGLSEVYESNKNGIDRFLGQDDRAEAATLAEQAAADQQSARDQVDRAATIQSSRYSAESDYLAAQQERYDTLYAPIEQSLSAELQAGGNTQEAAAIAGGDYANQFDASTAARDRAQLAQGISTRAGSSSGNMQADNDAYARASGIATAQTAARREEDDQNFLRSTAFYNANGSGIQDRLQSGMQTMYGTDYNAALNQAEAYRTFSNTNQDNSTALNAQSYDGITSLVDVGTRVVGAVSSLGSGSSEEA
jgi:hypothetical protein